MAKKFFVLIFGLGFLMLTSCGGGGSSSGGGSAAAGTPQLTAFSLSPSSAPAGQRVTLTLNIAFTDSDGDLDGGLLVMKDNQTNAQASATFSATYAGVTSLNISEFINVNTGPDRGTFTMSAWIIDKKGHQSNVVTVPFTVT